MKAHVLNRLMTGRCPLFAELSLQFNNQGEVTPKDSVQTPATGVKNGVKQSKPKIWNIKRSKAHHAN